MKINYPHKTIKKVIKRILNRKSSRQKAFTEDDMDHRKMDLIDDLGPISTEADDAKYGQNRKGFHKPEMEDGL